MVLTIFVPFLVGDLCYFEKLKKEKFQQLSKNNKWGGLNKERCGWKLFPELISRAGRLLGT